MNRRLRKAEDADRQRMDGDWGTMWILANGEAGNSSEMTVGRVIIKKGQCNPRHSHPNCEEVLYLTGGRLEYYVGDQERYVLSPGDTLGVPAGVPHYGRAIGDEDAEMVVAFSSAVREFQPE